MDRQSNKICGDNQHGYEINQVKGLTMANSAMSTALTRTLRTSSINASVSYLEESNAV